MKKSQSLTTTHFIYSYIVKDIQKWETKTAAIISWATFQLAARNLL